MQGIKPGVLRNIVDKYGEKYKNFFSLEATAPWGGSAYTYNFVENLLKYNTSDDDRYWSAKQVNASITISFNQEIRINSYALQAMYHPDAVNYPRSWEVYVLKANDNNNWRLVDYHEKNDYLKEKSSTKRFFFRRTSIRKFKIVQLSNNYVDQNNRFYDCFALKWIELYKSLMTIANNSKKNMNILMIITLLMS